MYKDSSEDIKKIMRAVLEAAAIDYVKLQHKKNRSKKFLEESYYNAIDLFFDDNFRFESFTDENDETKFLSTKDLLIKILNTTEVNMESVRKNIVQDAFDYWLNKNFHDLSIPDKISISGLVFTTVNSPKNHYVDYQNNRIYCPLKKKGADRIFLKLCLEVILKNSSIELTSDQLKNLFDHFYLFLKINSAFN